MGADPPQKRCRLSEADLQLGERSFGLKHLFDLDVFENSYVSVCYESFSHNHAIATLVELSL